MELWDFTMYWLLVNKGSRGKHWLGLVGKRIGLNDGWLNQYF